MTLQSAGKCNKEELSKKQVFCQERRDKYLIDYTFLQ